MCVLYTWKFVNGESRKPLETNIFVISTICRCFFFFFFFFALCSLSSVLLGSVRIVFFYTGISTPSNTNGKEYEKNVEEFLPQPFLNFLHCVMHVSFIAKWFLTVQNFNVNGMICFKLFFPTPSTFWLIIYNMELLCLRQKCMVIMSHIDKCHGTAFFPEKTDYPQLNSSGNREHWLSTRRKNGDNTVTCFIFVW